ncbi:MAG: AmmeMemoRadiSam system protein A [Terriglobia bacterium]|jgi:AmmeMemoRadiSam system protein A
MLQLTDAEKQRLLDLARKALEEVVRLGRMSEPAEPAGALQTPCGAFVTLYKGRRLRGCIGLVEARRPLYATVRECARAAALDDPRFDPVAPAELLSLRLEISILSPLADVAPQDVEVGRHGLLISRGAQRGLLLPQVAVEWNWEREQFLEETCLKAGLPADAWQHGARIQAFTAQVLKEPSKRAHASPPAS